MIDRILAIYRAKDSVFGHIPEPQFRILLDLAGNGQRDTTGLAMLAGAPMTTALRHLGEMAERGLIERHGDPFDRRKTTYRLTETGASYINTLSERLAA